MQRLLDQLGSAAAVLCALSCACVVGLFIFGGLLVRWAGVSLVPLIGDLIVGRVDRTPESRTAALPRPTSGAVLKTQAQSLDFDEALRRQGGVPVQAQSAAYPAQGGFGPVGHATAPMQAPPAGYPVQPNFGSTGYTAQSAAPGYGPALQSLPPAAPPQMPAVGGIQPLYDNRVQPQAPFGAQSAAPLSSQPYPAATPYTPLGTAPNMPSLSGPVPSVNPAYQPLGGYPPPVNPGPPADPNAFFPPPSGGIPRRASLSAPRDVSGNTMAQEAFDEENYPGLRSRGRRRQGGQEIVDDQGDGNRGGVGGIINDLGNMIGL